MERQNFRVRFTARMSEEEEETGEGEEFTCTSDAIKVVSKKSQLESTPKRKRTTQAATREVVLQALEEQRSFMDEMRQMNQQLRDQNQELMQRIEVLVGTLEDQAQHRVDNSEGSSEECEPERKRVRATPPPLESPSIDYGGIDYDTYGFMDIAQDEDYLPELPFESFM
eukprot:TRINITY_DN1946_c0_g1_i2.p1 TRINITY_DN1946_c0_g1~~TRINITY_DN1946_c0_g1_i2.p1  ORF type:complete len:169 (-),score=6.78 TRINITY_DN1946_c0_g1_i2:93-599(-)